MERRRGRRWCAPNENESVEHKPTKPRNNRIAVSPVPVDACNNCFVCYVARSEVMN